MIKTKLFFFGGGGLHPLIIAAQPNYLLSEGVILRNIFQYYQNLKLIRFWEQFISVFIPDRKHKFIRTPLFSLYLWHFES